MDNKNYNKLNNETIDLIKNIIYTQNINLIKNICHDYNRDPKILIKKYNLGEYS
jgi:hypothetical protein